MFSLHSPLAPNLLDNLATPIRSSPPTNLTIFAALTTLKVVHHVTLLTQHPNLHPCSEQGGGEHVLLSNVT